MTANGLDLLFAALAIVLAFICWLMLEDISLWANHQEDEALAERGTWDCGLGGSGRGIGMDAESFQSPAPRSVSVPYDWARDDAA